jgi:Na+-transporting NADH:ubiquinone oxidoreductase subunit NqrD
VYHRRQRLMSPAVKKSLALGAFVLMISSLVVTLVRPRIPGSHMGSAELIAIAVQIILAVISLRVYRQ